MNSYIVKILIFVLGLFILITVGSQVVLSFKDDYDIETAVSYVAVDRVSFDVVFLRNEPVVTVSSKGVISYPYPDGSKFSKTFFCSMPDKYPSPNIAYISGPSPEIIRVLTMDSSKLLISVW